MRMVAASRAQGCNLQHIRLQAGLVATLSRGLDAEHSAEVEEARVAVEALAASLAPRPGPPLDEHARLVLHEVGLHEMTQLVIVHEAEIAALVPVVHYLAQARRHEQWRCSAAAMVAAPICGRGCSPR